MVIGARTAAWSNSLPYERLVNYIQSSGTQWINTGVVPTANTKIEFKFLLPTLPADTYCCFCGSMDGSFQGFILFCNQNVNLQARVGSNKGPNTISSLPVVVDFLYYGSLELNKLVLNGTVYTPTSLNTMITLSAPLRILSANDYPSRRIISGRVYYFKMYESGELIRDLIPVIDKSGVACLYNRAYKPDGSHGLEFYTNAGTGVFTYG